MKRGVWLIGIGGECSSFVVHLSAVAESRVRIAAPCKYFKAASSAVATVSAAAVSASTAAAAVTETVSAAAVAASESAEAAKNIKVYKKVLTKSRVTVNV